MPYADSDFFLAIIKESDWLSKNARNILNKYSDNIWTSKWTVVEVLLVSQEFGLDPEIIVDSIRQIATIDGDTNVLFAAAHLMKEKGMKTFDAIHAVICGNDAIISSDSIYDKIGLERIKLEP